TPEIPQSCQWAIFLRNHDELTLEMVTDEERDYMYRMYARDSQAKINLGIRRRLAPLLGNNRRKIELVNILLFSFPGTPVLYYGDEIGMGDNYYLGDRNGVRTPMQWTPDRNAGFSNANPHRLYLPIIIDPEYHYESINVENQDANLSSLLWWMRRVIDMRKRYKAFGRGSLEMLYSDNPKVLTFVRSYQDEQILVVANLSRFSQVVTLHLTDYEGYVPEEVFSHNNFPLIGKRPYTLTLGPYNHYWLLLKKKEEGVGVGPTEVIPEITVRKSWESILAGKTKEKFEEKILPQYLRRCRWFAAKSRTIRRVSIIEDAVFDSKSSGAHILLLELSYSEGQVEHYCLPISFSWENTGPDAFGTEQPPLPGTICKISVSSQSGIVYDGTYDERLQQEMLQVIAKRRKIQGNRGVFTGSPSKLLRTLIDIKEYHPSRQLKAEQSNTSIVYGEKLFMKLYRRLDEGTNPELEVMRFLSDRAGYTHIPPYAGALEYRRNTGEPVTVALLQGFVENAGNAWTYTLDMMVRYFEQVLQRKEELVEVTRRYPSMLDVTLDDVPTILREIIGELYLEQTALLGRRTAEMHLALGSSRSVASFAPEPFTLLYQRSMYQSMQSLVRRTFQMFSRSTRQLPESIRSRANTILGQESKILTIMKQITGKKIPAMKIRIHGDYHLGQVLYTGKDFVIMDFEGEPARALSERKLKHSPFKDVAGMIRSYHYAGFGSLFLNTAFRPEDIEVLQQWIEPWYHYTAGIFLRSYLDTVQDAPFVPDNRQDLEPLLQVYLLEKAVYELGYELNNRPDWVSIPLKGIDDVIRGTL
ncbi:MAG: putative maltokinase, partial [Chitinivibrionales bacterium]